MMKCIGLMLVMAACALSPLQAGERAPAPVVDHGTAAENTATFVSATGERLIASYDKQTDSVLLTLPDGSRGRLPHAISGSGARYANDRMVFWEHQGEVSVWINGKLVFKGGPATP